MKKQENLSFFEMIKPHLIEMRTRMVWIAISVLVGMVGGLGLVFGPTRLVEYIIVSFAPTDRPYPPLQAVGTAEVFTSYMLIAFVSGIILAMPIILSQILAFIYPALEYEHEKKFVRWALPFVVLLFMAGIAFGWFITVPVAIQFLMGFGNTTLISNQPALSDFLRTISLLILVNGIVFEIPVVMYMLTTVNLVTPYQLTKYRRFAILIVTVIAAVVTPTGDPINLMLLAIPMYLLYEIGILVSWLVPNRKK